MLWPDLTFVLHIVDWFENFSSWDWVLAGVILFLIMLFILPGLCGLPLQLHDKVFNFNSMKNYCGEGIKEFFSSIFYTEDNWHAFIEPPFVFVYKAYNST